jgi:hypothetical protein
MYLNSLVVSFLLLEFIQVLDIIQKEIIQGK